MKFCNQCAKKLRSDYKFESCQKCLSVCDCGNYKDWRARECRSCSSKKVAVKQWKNAGIRKKMLGRMKDAGIVRRTKFEDLTEKSFYPRKHDGRYQAQFWNEAGKRVQFYRYRWVWIKANGAIPDGFVVHHKDGNQTNDDLPNLELLTESQHAIQHGLSKPKAEWICQNCGVQFPKGRRQGKEPRKFCSQKCHYDFVAGKSETKCKTFEAANEFTKALPLIE